MLHVNESYAKIKPTYLFAEIAHRVAAHKAANPEAKIIRLGIGDVTEPICPAIVEAMHRAVDDEAGRENFHGYGPEQGYAFLREKIAAVDFRSRGMDIEADEILVSDGAKCDCGNIQELFGPDVKIAVGDPVYPVYVDTNIMAGRTDIQLLP
ncbi:MAG: aminotransferase class I/II-fold pyridoxal phosphate-dependent enzyme, partial [Kiritimatiellae bacterium]|nr:aminotransferase class I/II-fold pyridoxal phosphate-dependent enzyme [Kiritimatiellia bacterium]